MISSTIKVLKFNAIKCYPCSQAEIQGLKGKFGNGFPQCYIDFLEYMGKGADQYMTGSFAYYNELDLINLEAKELIKVNSFKSLPENAFVFWMHQGYQFAFFLLADNDNPSVYYYNEAIPLTDFRKTYDRLSDFYYDELINSGIPIPKALQK
jgi:hypothetical protein